MKDQVGTVYKVFNETTRVMDTMVYDTFGNLVNQAGSSRGHLAFQGKYYDSETGLYYFYHRYYNPSLGRFMTEDPIGFGGGLNFYGFVGNNSVNLVDPMGLIIGAFPPPPPGYNPNTWTQGQWPNGKYWLLDPTSGDKYSVHPEDSGHWRHWDIQDNNHRMKDRWPSNSGKRKNEQNGKNLKPHQSDCDPSGNSPEWEPVPQSNSEENDNNLRELFEDGYSEKLFYFPIIDFPIPPIPSVSPLPVPVFI